MEKNKTTEEIKVLDKGKNLDNNFIIMMAFCCGGLIIPFRW